MQRQSRTVCFLGAVVALAIAYPPQARGEESLDGYWIDSDGEVILEVGPCGPVHCGKVAWLKQPLGPDGRALRDYRNPDPALQKRSVCGLEVVSGFKKQDDGTWGDGTVYVSDLGTSYSGYAEILSPTKVKVTGYVGLTIFGASEVWTRVAKPVKPCAASDTKPPVADWTTKTIPAPNDKLGAKHGDSPR